MEQQDTRAPLIRADGHHAAAGAGAMGDANAACFHSFLEELLGKRMSSADRFLADGFTEHFDGMSRNGRDFVASIAEALQCLPDAAWTIEMLVALNDVVLCHLTAKSPANPRESWENFVVRFTDGRMAECWRSSHAVQPHAQTVSAHGVTGGRC